MQEPGPVWERSSHAKSRQSLSRFCDAPERGRLFEQDVRRCLTRRFPYALLYTIEADYILILAVMHGSREPGYWRHRIEPGA